MGVRDRGRDVRQLFPGQPVLSGVGGLLRAGKLLFWGPKWHFLCMDVKLHNHTVSEKRQCSPDFMIFFFPILTHGRCSPERGRSSLVLGLLPSPSPAPRDRGIAPDMRKAKGRHSPGSQQQPGGERERDRKTTGSEGAAQPLTSPDSGGILAEAPKMTSPRLPCTPRGQPDLKSHPCPALGQCQHRWLSGGGGWPCRVSPPPLGLGYQPDAPRGVSLCGPSAAANGTLWEHCLGQGWLKTTTSWFPPACPGWLCQENTSWGWDSCCPADFSLCVSFLALSSSAVHAAHAAHAASKAPLPLPAAAPLSTVLRGARGRTGW